MSPASTCPSAPGADALHRGVIVRQTRASDIDEHTGHLQDWDLRYDQLEPGRFAGGFTDIRWPGMQLFVETTALRVRQQGRLLPDSIGIGTLLEGQGAMRVDGVPSGPGAMVAADSTEVDLCTPPACTLAGVVIDARALHEAAERIAELGPLLRPGAMLSMTPSRSAHGPWCRLLTETVHALLRHPERLNDAAVRRRLHGDLLTATLVALTSACRDDPIRGADQRKRVVDRACELLLSQPDEPPSLFEVCQRVGTSPRKLGYCFQDVLGISPARYVKTIRLNSVRRELARPIEAARSVYDVAARWGFWHFGHFSEDYRKQFDELPSETLRRARASLAARA